MRIPGKKLTLQLICLIAVYIPALLHASHSGGTTLYVSKLGSDSDGSSWTNAFSTIQAALNAIPDDKGSHRIIIRPDTYFEAMLFPAHKGAKGAYNELIGDFDGSLGSGTEGWVIIDSSDPEQGGFKSYDWWGPIRSNFQGWSKEHTDSTFSAIGWDRWYLRNLYVTGGDAGIFFDLTDQVKPFSVIVEHCIAIGRAFGAGVGNCLSRSEEPITFRNCHLWALDWWGDTGGAYVRVENEKMPAQPDVRFEGCTMVSPQCALKSGNYGFHTFSHIKSERCRLIALNFSQPHGTPTDGIIQSVQEGKYLKLDLQDCTLMGYKVFGVIVNKETIADISYTVKGDVKAYIQFQQDIPAGFHRLSFWPVELFQNLMPPSPYTFDKVVGKKHIQKDLTESALFIWQGRLCRMDCMRPGSGGKLSDYYLLLKDIESGKELARCAEGYGLASIFVKDNTVYIFASRWQENAWKDVTLFKSSNLKDWQSKIVIKGNNEQIFNTSVCQGADGFILVYESNDPAYPAFTIKFARSSDLENWTLLPEATFGTNRYTACPCIRYANGWYYVLYVEHRKPRWYFETYLTRSKDLRHWELSSANPVLKPEGLDEGINASDPDIIEFQGNTYLYYSVGDQRTWMNLKCAIYPGTMDTFFESWYNSPGISDFGTASGAAAAKPINIPE
jgi:hypothetical protein